MVIEGASVIADLFEIKDTKDRGKGLFAKDFIPKGTIVHFECSKCKTRTDEETNRLPENELEWVLDHEYRGPDGLLSDVCNKNILYMNHSCNSNILFHEDGFDVAVRDIKKGEEVTYDYRFFFGESDMECDCGEPNCAKVIEYIHPVPVELKKFWQRKLKRVMRLVNQVKQPLKPELLKQYNDLYYIKADPTFRKVHGLE
jgi:hypothetical protein